MNGSLSAPDKFREACLTCPLFLTTAEFLPQHRKQLDDTHVHWHAEIWGKDKEWDAEITEQHPEERIAWASTSGEAKHAGVVTFHRLDDAKTRVMIQIDWEPEGLVEKAGAALGFDDRQVKADAKKFKEFIESRGTETGAWRGDVSRPDQQ